MFSNNMKKLLSITKIGINKNNNKLILANQKSKHLEIIFMR